MAGVICLYSKVPEHFDFLLHYPFCAHYFLMVCITFLCFFHSLASQAVLIMIKMGLRGRLAVVKCPLCNQTILFCPQGSYVLSVGGPSVGNDFSLHLD